MGTSDLSGASGCKRMGDGRRKFVIEDNRYVSYTNLYVSVIRICMFELVYLHVNFLLLGDTEQLHHCIPACYVTYRKFREIDTPGCSFLVSSCGPSVGEKVIISATRGTLTYACSTVRLKSVN